MDKQRPLFNGKDTQAWAVTIEALQDHDDDSPHEGENPFKLSMHLSPAGGYYFRINGEIALDFDELEGLKSQLDQIAKILNWQGV